MAWYTPGFLKKNDTKKWNKVVNKISNQQEAQKLLKRQAQQQRDYATARKDSARQRSVSRPKPTVRWENMYNKRNQ